MFFVWDDFEEKLKNLRFVRDLGFILKILRLVVGELRISRFFLFSFRFNISIIVILVDYIIVEK